MIAFGYFYIAIRTMCGGTRSSGPSIILSGCWPRRMSAAMAAGYCGETTVEDLLKRVGRDIQVIAETFRVAKLTDLNGVEKQVFGEDDPRRCFFTILERLRISQPVTFQTSLASERKSCDLDVGLYLEEEFNRGRLTKGNVRPDAKLISDIERLRTLHGLCKNLLAKNIADVRMTTRQKVQVR
jgi:hypothetical protein